VLAAAVMTALFSMAVCAAAVLVPSPAPVVPLVLAVCVGARLLAPWEAPSALACVPGERSRRRAFGRAPTQRPAAAGGRAPARPLMSDSRWSSSPDPDDAPGRRERDADSANHDE